MYIHTCIHMYLQTYIHTYIYIYIYIYAYDSTNLSIFGAFASLDAFGAPLLGPHADGMPWLSSPQVHINHMSPIQAIQPDAQNPNPLIFPPINSRPAQPNVGYVVCP